MNRSTFLKTAAGSAPALLLTCSLVLVGCRSSEAASSDVGASSRDAQATRSQPATMKVADFESGLRMAGGLEAKAIDDRAMGGASQVVLSVEPGGVAGGAHALHIKGQSVREAFPFPFAGVAIPLGPSTGDGPAPIDLRSHAGVQFWAKGNGKTYLLRVNSTRVKDYNFHHHTFVVGPEWTRVRVLFSEVEQYGWGTKVPWVDAAASVSSLAVVSDSQPTGTFGPIDLSVDDISFF